MGDLVCAGCGDIIEDAVHHCNECDNTFCDFCFDTVTGICWGCLDEIVEEVQ